MLHCDFLRIQFCIFHYRRGICAEFSTFPRIFEQIDKFFVKTLRVLKILRYWTRLSNRIIPKKLFNNRFKVMGVRTSHDRLAFRSRFQNALERLSGDTT